MMLPLKSTLPENSSSRLEGAAISCTDRCVRHPLRWYGMEVVLMAVIQKIILYMPGNF